jgi:hypothetical protein
MNIVTKSYSYLIIEFLRVVSLLSLSLSLSLSLIPTSLPIHATNNIIVGVTVAAVLLLFLLISACFLCHKKYRGMPAPEEGPATPPKTKPSQPNQRTKHLKRYTYSEVERMTKIFAHDLGHGSCGDVYRGNLRDGPQVVLKLLKNCKGDDKEFMSEVAIINRVSHVNVVPLMGFCLQGPDKSSHLRVHAEWLT